MKEHKEDFENSNDLVGLDLTWKEKKAMILAAYSVVLPIATIFFIAYFLFFVFVDMFWL